MTPSSQPVDTSPYTPYSLLAAGAFSQVWVADGPSGQVALKMARSDAHRGALEREAQVLQQGTHPNLGRLIEAAADHSCCLLYTSDAADE